MIVTQDLDAMAIHKAEDRQSVLKASRALLKMACISFGVIFFYFYPVI
jgi:hypothetical protein